MFRNIWKACCSCARAKECKDPFPPSGACPSNGLLVGTREHPVVNTTDWSKEYVDALEKDPRVASIYEKWRRGFIIEGEDFLYLRELTFSTFTDDNTPESLWLLSDIYRLPLSEILADFHTYYGLPLDLVGPALQYALSFAVDVTGPEVITGWASEDSDFTRHIIDAVRFKTWFDLQIGYLDTDTLSDDDFRHVFETEWEALQGYRDLLYGYRVIPKLSINAFRRYTGLKRGDNTIRRTITDHFVHQAKEYPHIFTPWFSHLAESIFGRRLRDCYKPLVEKTAKEALTRLQMEKPTPEEKKEMREWTWKIYDKAWTDFKFYFDHVAENRPLGHNGILGFAHHPDTRKAFDEVMSCLGIDVSNSNLCEVGFSHYITQQFNKWLSENCPTDVEVPKSVISIYQPSDDEGEIDITDSRSYGDWLFGQRENVDDENLDGIVESPDQTLGSTWACTDGTACVGAPSVVGKDGLFYYTISQAAQIHGVSVDSLRRLDRSGTYKASRFRDIVGANSTLKPSTRLYSTSPEEHDQLYKAILRAKMKASKLSGTELNRKQAAIRLGIPVSLLRRWERLGLLVPESRGRSVVYDIDCLAAASQLCDKAN